MCETRKTPADLPLDTVAQALGLDIFDYQLPDVLGMIACLQESERHAADKELRLELVKGSNEREIAALRKFIEVLLLELIAHPEMPATIGNKLKAYQQTLTMKAIASPETEVASA